MLKTRLAGIIAFVVITRNTLKLVHSGEAGTGAGHVGRGVRGARSQSLIRFESFDQIFRSIFAKTRKDASSPVR